MQQVDEEHEGENEELTTAEKPGPLNLLLALRGSGKHLWADEHADEYVANLRKDWD